MKLSLIVPIFSDSSKYVNRLPLMRRLWVALLNQTDMDFELIVVDNNSTDDVAGLLHQYFPQQTLLHHPTAKHRSGARNLAAKAAAGDYLVFLDADCLPYPTYIQNIKATIEKLPYATLQGMFFPYHGVIHSGTEFIVNNQIDYRALEAIPTLDKNYRGTYITSLKEASQSLAHYQPWKKEPQVHTGNLCLPKKAFVDCGMLDEDFTGWGYEDSMLGYQLRRIGLPMYILYNIPVIHQCHRVGNTDLSHVEDCANEPVNRELFLQKLKAGGYEY